MRGGGGEGNNAKPFVYVGERDKRSVKNFAVSYPADGRTGRALGVGQCFLADKRGMDFDFRSAGLSPAFSVKGGDPIAFRAAKILKFDRFCVLWPRGACRLLLDSLTEAA